MPAISADNLTRLRTTIHRTVLGLACYAPATIWTARLNGAHAQGATSLAVDGVVQVRAPAADYLVCFGTAAGARDLGTARFRSYSAPTLVVDAHDSLLADDTYITVLEEVKPESRHPMIDDNDVVFENGNVAYGSSLNEQFPPLARIGCPAVATRTPGSGLASVFFWADPVAVAPGATITGHAWDFRDGTPSTSALQGTPAVPIEVVFNSAGARYVSYTCTDSNGKTHARRTPVFVFDPETGTLPYTQLEIENAEADRESGAWRVSVKVYCDARVAYFPNQALVVLFARDYYGAEAVSIGNVPWRENIVLTGYIRKGSVKRHWSGGYVQFEIESLSGVMDNLWGLAGGLESTAGTPSGWHQLKALDHNLAAHHLLVQHSTISQIADVHLNLPTYPTEYLDLEDASLAEQLRGLCAGVLGQVGCNAEGVLYLESNPQLLPLASRSSTHVLSTTDADVRDEIEFGEEEQEHQVSQIDFCGDDANADPLFSVAPATPHSTGRSERVEGVRVANQAAANVVAGLLEGERNNLFKDVILPWRGNYRAVPDIFPAEPVAVNADPTKNNRGLSWSNQRCWTKRRSYEYRPGGILLSTSVVEKDSYGNPGITGDYPTDEPPVPPPTVPPPEPPPEEPPAPPTTTMTGDGSRVYLATDRGIAVTSNLLAGSPTWAAANNGLSGDALDVYRFLFDPFSSNGTYMTTAYLVTKGGVYKATDLPTPTWTCLLTLSQIRTMLQSHSGEWASALLTRELILPINIPNYVGFVVDAPYESFGWQAYLWYFYSTNGGSTWHVVNLSTPKGNIENFGVPGLAGSDGWYALPTFPSHKVANTIWHVQQTTENPTKRVVKSVTGGANWSNVAAWVNAGTEAIVIPYADAAGVSYAGDGRAWRGAVPNPSGVYATGVNGIQLLPNWPSESGALAKGAVGMLSLWNIDLCTWDEDYVYGLEGWDYSTGNQGVTQKVWSTNTGGGTWQSVDVGWVPRALSALPANAQFCVVAGSQYTGVACGRVKLSLDGGITFVDKTGDLVTVLPNIARTRSIVPDWIKVTP